MHADEDTPSVDAAGGDGAKLSDPSSVPVPAPEPDSTSAAAGDSPPARSGIVRRLYDWVLHWAHTPYGAPALFLISFCESSFFPIPPDPLLLAMGISRPRRAIWYGVLCTIASVLGGLLGYAIGVYLYDAIGVPILEAYGLVEKFEELKGDFTQAGFIAVLIAALTPVPYKVFTIASGGAALSLPIFISASLLGRGLRFITEAWLVGRFGEPIRGFIDRWFTWLAWGFIVLGVGGFLLVKVIFGGGGH